MRRPDFLRAWQPPGWLTRNIRVKVLAVLLALASWVVVVYAANPPDQRQILVHVQQDSQLLPGRYVLAHPIPDIAVHISGTRDRVDAFQLSSIHATPNFDAIHRTGVQQLPLTVVNTDPNVEVQDAPSTVMADVDLEGATTAPVQVNYGRTEVGYVVSSATSDPSRVQLTGPERELAYAKAVVNVNLGTRTATLVQDGVTVVAVDPRNGNRPLSDVNVTPAEVRVTVAIEAAAGQAISTVLPVFSGTVAPGHIVSQVTVDPQTVTLSGAENLLNAAQQIQTVPLPLNGLSSDHTFTAVPLQLPQGLGFAPGSVTTVTVHITVVTLPEAVVTPTGPGPASQPTPSPSSTSRTTSTSCTTQSTSGLTGLQTPTRCP